MLSSLVSVSVTLLFHLSGLSDLPDALGASPASVTNCLLVPHHSSEEVICSIQRVQLDIPAGTMSKAPFVITQQLL